MSGDWSGLGEAFADGFQRARAEALERQKMAEQKRMNDAQIAAFQAEQKERDAIAQAEAQAALDAGIYQPTALPADTPQPLTRKQAMGGPSELTLESPEQYDQRKARTAYKASLLKSEQAKSDAEKGLIEAQRDVAKAEVENIPFQQEAARLDAEIRQKTLEVRQAEVEAGRANTDIARANLEIKRAELEEVKDNREIMSKAEALLAEIPFNINPDEFVAMAREKGADPRVITQARERLMQTQKLGAETSETQARQEFRDKQFEEDKRQFNEKLASDEKMANWRIDASFDELLIQLDDAKQRQDQQQINDLEKMKVDFVNRRMEAVERERAAIRDAVMKFEMGELARVADNRAALISRLIAQREELTAGFAAEIQASNPNMDPGIVRKKAEKMAGSLTQALSAANNALLDYASSASSKAQMEARRQDLNEIEKEMYDVASRYKMGENEDETYAEMLRVLGKYQVAAIPEMRRYGRSMVKDKAVGDENVKVDDARVSPFLPNQSSADAAATAETILDGMRYVDKERENIVRDIVRSSDLTNPADIASRLSKRSWKIGHWAVTPENEVVQLPSAPVKYTYDDIVGSKGDLAASAFGGGLLTKAKDAVTGQTIEGKDLYDDVLKRFNGNLQAILDRANQSEDNRFTFSDFADPEKTAEIMFYAGKPSMAWIRNMEFKKKLTKN